MAVFNDFDKNGNYEGEKIVGLDEANFQRLIQEHGRAWVAGYIKALEVFTVDASTILRDERSSRRETPHMVRTKLQNYWVHNKDLLSELSTLYSSLSNDPDKPSVK